MLDPRISYKSTIPYLGNYDASVIVLALRHEGVDISFHDHRKK